MLFATRIFVGFLAIQFLAGPAWAKSPHEKCGFGLRHLTPGFWFNWIFTTRSNVHDLAKQKLFDDSTDARQLVLQFLDELFKSKPQAKGQVTLSRPHYISLKTLAKDTSLALYDPEVSQQKYKKNAEDVLVEDAFLKLEKIYRQRLTSFIQDPEAPIIRGQYVVGGRVIGKGARFTFYALVGVGLFATFTGAGKPLWNIVTAETEKMAFVVADWIVPASDQQQAVRDPQLQADLIQVYRLTKKHYSDVELISSNTATYLESATLQARMLLLNEEESSEPNLEAMKMVWEILNRWPDRFKGVLDGREGQRVKRLIELTLEEFHPEAVRARLETKSNAGHSEPSTQEP